MEEPSLAVDMNMVATMSQQLANPLPATCLHLVWRLEGSWVATLLLGSWRRWWSRLHGDVANEFRFSATCTTMAGGTNCHVCFN